MSKNRPFIITFIGDGCILSACLLILSLFPRLTEGIGVYFSPLPDYLWIPFLSEGLMKVLISITLLTIAYGFLRLKIWGYWLMVSTNVYFLAAGIITYLQDKQQSSYRNPIALIIGLVFIVPTIKYFGKKDLES
jgi:hypothetical protein